MVVMAMVMVMVMTRTGLCSCVQNTVVCMYARIYVYYVSLYFGISGFVVERKGKGAGARGL